MQSYRVILTIDVFTALCFAGLPVYMLWDSLSPCQLLVNFCCTLSVWIGLAVVLSWPSLSVCFVSQACDSVIQSFCSFLRLINTPVCGHTICYLSLLLLLDIWIVSFIWLWWIISPWTSAYTSCLSLYFFLRKYIFLGEDQSDREAGAKRSEGGDGGAGGGVLHAVVLSPRDRSGHDGTESKAGARKFIQVSHTGSKDLATWVIICFSQTISNEQIGNGAAKMWTSIHIVCQCFR